MENQYSEEVVKTLFSAKDELVGRELELDIFEDLTVADIWILSSEKAYSYTLNIQQLHALSNACNRAIRHIEKVNGR